MAKNVLINGVTYNAVPHVAIPLAAGGGNAVFYETSDATADAASILAGYSAYTASGKVNGSATVPTVSQDSTPKVLTISERGDGMAQDITLMGASFSGVPGVRLPKTGGGQALFSDASVTTAVASDVATGKTFLLADGTPAVGTNSGGGGGETWSWMGRNPTRIASWNGDVALADTDFATWTPSTTATTIIASAKAGEFEANMADYDYLIYNKFSIVFVYKAGTSLKATPYSESTTGAISLTRVPSNGTSFLTKENFTWTKSLIPGNQTNPLMYYYNSSGAIRAYCSSTAYGIYSGKVSTSTITFSGTTGNTKTVSVNMPNLIAKCGSSYFASARAADIDQEATIARRTIEVWRVDVDTSPVGFVWHDGVTLLGDPYNQ